VKRLLDAGVSLQNIRTAVDHLRKRGVVELERITLMSDGSSIYECASPDEIVDLLAGGQGVFGIAVGKVWHEVEGSLSMLQGELSTEDGSQVRVEGNDELSMRRKAKGA
jgi:DNA-binding transcriptional MerR regulator